MKAEHFIWAVLGYLDSDHAVTLSAKLTRPERMSNVKETLLAFDSHNLNHVPETVREAFLDHLIAISKETPMTTEELIRGTL